MDEELENELPVSRPASCASNPMDGMSDIQSLQGASYFFPRMFEDENVSAGMMARHIIINDRHGAFTQFNVDYPDLVFMMSVLSQMLRDDSRILQSFSSYKLIGNSKTATTLNEQIKITIEALEEVKGVIEAVEVYTPKDFRKDSES